MFSLFFFHEYARPRDLHSSLHDALPIFRVNLCTALANPAERILIQPEDTIILQNQEDRKSTRLNSSHLGISYAVFCLKKKKHKPYTTFNDVIAPRSTTDTKQHNL